MNFRYRSNSRHTFASPRGGEGQSKPYIDSVQVSFEKLKQVKNSTRFIK